MAGKTRKEDFDPHQWFVEVAADGHMDNLADGVVITPKDRLRAAENVATIYPDENGNIAGRPTRAAKAAIKAAQQELDEAQELADAKAEAERLEQLERDEESEHGTVASSSDVGRPTVNHS